MNIIFSIHVALFITAILVPFMNNEKFLEIYSILIPLLFFHWGVNDDTCALTQLEMYTTGKEKTQTFFGRLVEPIYKIDDTRAGKVTKTLLFSLWLMVQYRLERIPGLNKIHGVLYR
jgi:hypothetical protein